MAGLWSRFRGPLRGLLRLSLCALLHAAVVAAESGRPLVTVSDVTGEGRTEDEAVKRALLAGIRFVCGEYIQVREEMLGRRTREQILSLSNGSIRDFRVTSRRATADGFAVTLDCVVERASPGLIGKLPEEVEAVSCRALWAQVFSEHKGKREAFALLREMLPRIASEALGVRCVQVADRVVSAEAPSALRLGDSWQTAVATLGFPVEVYADREFWRESALPLLTRCLDVLAQSHRDQRVRLEPVPARPGVLGPAEFQMVLPSGVPAGPAELLGLDRVRDARRLRELAPRVLSLDMPLADAAAESVIRSYVFDPETWQDLHRLFSGLERARVLVTLLGEAEESLFTAASSGRGHLLHRLHYRPPGSRQSNFDAALPGTLYLGPRFSCRWELLEAPQGEGLPLVEFRRGTPERLASLHDPETSLLESKLLLFRVTLGEEQLRQVASFRAKVGP